MAEAQPTNRYKNKKELRKDIRLLGLIMLVPELVLVGGTLVRLVFDNARRDDGFNFIFIILLIIHTAIVYFLGIHSEYRLEKEEREYEQELEREKIQQREKGKK